jgi:hypothetical protein
MIHLSEEELVLYYYADAGDAASTESHLAACDSCRAVYRELQQTLALVSSLAVPERPENYSEVVWDRIRPRLRPRHRLGWPSALGSPRWAMATGMVALLIAAFLAGRYWPRQDQPVAQQQVRGDAAGRILLASAADHLERSQIILTEIVHAGGNGAVDISAEKEWARDLLESNRIYRLAAGRSGETGLAVVLDDLERTLLEIVHSPSPVAAAELGEMRQQIVSGGILFKLRVTSARMRDRQNASARELGRRTT